MQQSMKNTETGKNNGCEIHYGKLSARPSSAACWFHVHLLVILLALGPVSIQPLNAQPLDDVVESLLDDDGGGNLCVNLTDAGATPTGNLAAFCGQGGSGTPSSTGGGAGTPQSAPGIVQERLEAARGEHDGQSETGTVSELAPGWNLFISAEGETLDRDVTTFEDGYDSTVLRGTIGTDYRLNSKGILGLALTYSSHEGDYTGGGDFENDSFGFMLFASFVPHENMYVQVTAGYAWKNYDRTRLVTTDFTTPLANPINDFVTADFDGSEFSTGFLIGYDYTVGRLTIGPRIGLDWIFTEYDDYTEQGNTGLELVFDDTDETSIQSRVGFAGSFAISTGFGVLVPQLSADWVHEFADDQRTLAFSFKDDTSGVKFTYEDEDPDTNFFEIGLGISAVLPNGWLPYVQFRTIAGHDFLDGYVGGVGLRKEF